MSTSSEKLKTYSVYTDGSFRKFAKSGKSATAWGFVITNHKLQEIIRHAESYPDKTINQAELRAVIEALSYIPDEKATVRIFSDSMYVVNSLNWWIDNWRKRNWKSLDGTDIKNREYMEELWEYKQQFNIQMFHIKAHQADDTEVDKFEQPSVYYNQQVDRMVQDITRGLLWIPLKKKPQPSADDRLKNLQMSSIQKRRKRRERRRRLEK